MEWVDLHIGATMCKTMTRRRIHTCACNYAWCGVHQCQSRGHIHIECIYIKPTTSIALTPLISLHSSVRLLIFVKMITNRTQNVCSSFNCYCSLVISCHWGRHCWFLHSFSSSTCFQTNVYMRRRQHDRPWPAIPIFFFRWLCHPSTWLFAHMEPLLNIPKG